MQYEGAAQCNVYIPLIVIEGVCGITFYRPLGMSFIEIHIWLWIYSGSQTSALPYLKVCQSLSDVIRRHVRRSISRFRGFRWLFHLWTFIQRVLLQLLDVCYLTNVAT